MQLPDLQFEPQVGLPTNEPLLPLPEESTAVVPVLLSSFHQPTGGLQVLESPGMQKAAAAEFVAVRPSDLVEKEPKTVAEPAFLSISISSAESSELKILNSSIRA